jgi:hypothetical protein
MDMPTPTALSIGSSCSQKKQGEAAEDGISIVGSFSFRG